MLGLSPRTQLIGCLVLAGAGLVLFFSGEYRDLGLPWGWGGALLFVAATWFFVDALHRIPRSDEEERIAPGEWQAWIGLAFATALLVAALIAGAEIRAGHAIVGAPHTITLGKHVGILFLVWILLAQMLKWRWAGKVQADERDARIEALASQWGRGATTACILGIAVLLTFTGPERLRDFSYPFIGHLLIFALLWGLWFDQAVATILYWRDRRASA